MMIASAVDLDVPARIAKEIQALISRGTLSPGVHLGQSKLADHFSTSRVPVREALKLLAAQGTLVHDQHRGFFVAQLSSQEASQLYRMRRHLEVDLLSTVEWPDKTRVGELRRLVEELERLIDAGARAEWATKHREFHFQVLGLSPLKWILKEEIRLWTLTDRYRSLLLATARQGGSGAIASDSARELRLLAALEKQDRVALLEAYEMKRTQVEELLLLVLKDRGL